MRVIPEIQAFGEKEFFRVATEVANKSTLEEEKIGAIIVKDNEVIGTGWNTMPRGLDYEEYAQRFEQMETRFNKNLIIDAETKALIDAYSKNPDKVEDSRIYIASISKTGDIKIGLGNYFSPRSAAILKDFGIAEVAIHQDEAINIYDIDEYLEISFGLVEEGN